MKLNWVEGCTPPNSHDYDQWKHYSVPLVNALATMTYLTSIFEGKN